MAMTNPDKPRPPVEWLISDKPVGYEAAVTFMETRIGEIRAGTSPELIWLLEHPALYTAGTSARARDLLTPDRFPVHSTGRGGQYTYHGPGQRVIYVMLDVKQRGADVRAFVTALETWLIDVLAAFNVIGATHADRVGVWVRRPGRPVANASPIFLQSPHGKNSPPSSASDNLPVTEDKIGAIGIRLRKWVSYHGMSLNVAPCLDHFNGIVPCGITDHGVTSLKDLGIRVSMKDVDRAIRKSFERRFGATQTLPDLHNTAQQRSRT